MSPALHSTGPWQVNGMAGAGFWIVGADEDQIAVAYGPEVTKSGAANAKLIAAAPDMLAALKALLSELPNYMAKSEAVNKARAAIAKATHSDEPPGPPVPPAIPPRAFG